MSVPATGHLGAEAFRRQFPALGEAAYLASCSLGARHRGLDAAFAEMLDEVHRTGTPWAAYEHKVEAVREQAAALLRTTAEHIGLMPNASIGAYQVASTLSFERRRRIVSCPEEFPSISHVWLAQRSRGAEVLHVEPGHGDAESALAPWTAAIDERTALVSVPLVSYRTGAVLPVRQIAAHAHAAGARVFVDAYQAAGVLAVDAPALGADHLVAGTSKYLLGLGGLAFLYVRHPGTEDLPPSLTGWMGRVAPMSFDPTRLDFPAEARRFETGTPSVAALYAADASLRLLLALHPEEVQAHVLHLARRAHARLQAEGEQLAGDDPPAGPMVAMLDADPSRLAQGLAAHRVYGSPRGAALRIAFHHYNNEADVDALVDALRIHRRTARAVDHGGEGSRPGASRDDRRMDREPAAQRLSI
jgi:selenocysteine lyase/cysteine desulfurase